MTVVESTKKLIRTAGPEAFVSCLLILYIVFSYKNVPPFITDVLRTPGGKVAALTGLLVGSYYLHPATTVMLMLAVLISMPNFEFMTNPPPGHLVKDPKAPKVDTESRLRNAPASNTVKPKPKEKPSKKLKPAKKEEKEGFELFTGYDSD